jgi:prophage antirepressor-like protein
LIDAWWLWVMESLNDYEIDDEFRKWLFEFLLPAIYWQSQAAKTKNPKQ